MLAELIQEIDEKVSLMLNRLASLQNADGGFKAFYCHDLSSGVWTTAEIVHCAAKAKPHGPFEEQLRSACEYIVSAQNSDGGWPFRITGKSITDVTAWCCLALSHFGYTSSIAQGIKYILAAQTNVVTTLQEDGWGLTAFEPDRVYSTWIASYCLSSVLRAGTSSLSGIAPDKILDTLAAAKRWLLGTRKADGSWGVSADAPSHYTSTAVALLTLFIQGEDPVAFRSSYEFLKTGLREGLWPTENEIVVTREGYELSQDWFTSALCFRAMIFFAELGVAPIRDLHDIYQNLIRLIRSDGSVSLSVHGSAEIIWTIPFMLDALEKYRRLVESKEQEYSAFLYQRQQETVAEKKSAMERTLQSQFPFPISHAFFEYQHELDYNRRFYLMLQLYEVSIKYAATVGLAGYLLARETEPAIHELLAGNFRRPSLGDWSTLLQLLLRHSQGFARLLNPTQPHDILRSRKDYLEQAAPRLNLSDVVSRIVSLRNSNTGHGALRTIYEYKMMVEAEEHQIYSFFDRMRFMAAGNSFLVLASEYDEFGEGDRYKIRIFRGLSITDNDLETSSRLSEGQQESLVRYIYFQNTTNNVIVNLYPFLSYMFCEDCKREHFFFFNGLKQGGRVTYLSYECGHGSIRENGMHFQKRLAVSGVNWQAS